jgi:ankyrin repeat protein
MLLFSSLPNALDLELCPTPNPAILDIALAFAFMSALEESIREGDLDKVKRLVAEGADVKEAGADGYTALLEAAHCGDIPIMHWLLTEGGSSLTEQNIHGMNALMVAADKY